jgi:hypothetical protein
MLTSNSTPKKVVIYSTRNPWFTWAWDQECLGLPQMQIPMMDPPFSLCLTSWFTRLSLDFSHFLIHSLCELLCKFK